MGLLTFTSSWNYLRAHMTLDMKFSEDVPIAFLPSSALLFELHNYGRDVVRSSTRVTWPTLIFTPAPFPVLIPACPTSVSAHEATFSSVLGGPGS